ncbi:MAG: hypothetical protein HGB19_04625 [Chlorobiales bacterium]|nr:hypothetical protein [Chlorobiales bacterium]
MALVKLPVPVPSVVFVLNAVVGLGLVPQQTPRAITAAPPSDVMFPPLAAVICVMPVAAVVVKTGTSLVGLVLLSLLLHAAVNSNRNPIIVNG